MEKSINWLINECKNHLLAEKWLLCGSLRSCQTWKDRINLAGTATINLHGKTLHSAALGLIAESLAADQVMYLNNEAAVALVHQLLVDAQRTDSLQYFTEQQFTESLARLLAKSFRDLRLAEVSPRRISDAAFYEPAKAADVRQLYQAYCEALVAHKLVDIAGCLTRACEGIEQGQIRLPHNLLIVIPRELELTQAETRLLDTLTQHALVKRNSRSAATAETTRDQLARFSIQPKKSVGYLAGYGEANEVRAVVQSALQNIDEASNNLRFDDVELLVTDANTYNPLIYESLCASIARRVSSVSSVLSESSSNHAANELPVTFADGLPCIYSRPGRALRAWLRWVRTDCVQAKLVQMIREGVLQRPESAAEIGYARLASQLRKLAIGFQAERYLPTIDAAIEQARQAEQEYLRRGEEDEKYGTFPRDFGLPTLHAIQEMLRPILRFAPTGEETAAEVLKKAKKFLLYCVRHEDKLDRFARSRLLEDIDARMATLEFAGECSAAVLSWLEGLPVESRMLASGPRPGCIHVASLSSGGIAGRRQVVILGLDANRFPRPGSIDPVLLDDERAQISAALQTSVQSARICEQALPQVLEQAFEVDQVNLSFSFSTRDLVDGRTQSPSAALLEIFRITENRPDAHIENLLAHIGHPTAFASLDAEHWLDPSEVFLAELLSDGSGAQSLSRVETAYPHFQDQVVAVEQRAAPKFSHHDGWVPEAAGKLMPVAPQGRISPTRLEDYGTCARKFFFKSGLSVYPPDEWSVDQECWLNPLKFGSLVHSLFEKFLRAHSQQNLVPQLDRDLPTLLALLQNEIAIYQADTPAPNKDAFERQRDLLEDICEIFLRKEQEYCESRGAVPWVLEASIGLDAEPQSPIDCKEPVSLVLRDGRLLRLAGKIDRIDRLQQQGSEHYVIWDYKSGSSWGFEKGDPFQQGRKLQSFLYVGMLRHRLSAAGFGKDAAISFGYFFPSPKTEGERLEWTEAELKPGEDIVQHICDAIAEGLFPATTNASDCKFCDYVSVCKQPNLAAKESLYKLVAPENRSKLHAWRKLREKDIEETLK